MGANNQKGWKGETELRDYLNELFEPFGFRWERMGGIESSKWDQSLSGGIGGDVALVSRDWKTKTIYRNPEECILYDFLWDAKWHNSANPVAWVKKAEKDAKKWDKEFGLVYGVIGKNKKHRTIYMSNRTYKNNFKDIGVSPYKEHKGLVYVYAEEFKNIINNQY